MEKQQAQEPNWTELLEKEYGQDYRKLIDVRRADGHPDKETYQLLDRW